MISVHEASNIVMNHLGNFAHETVPLGQSIGRVLKEDILADQPFPSFDRVMMDGIAINAEGWESSDKTFPIQGTQPAGTPKLVLNKIDHCIEVMTGAVLPENTNVVIPYEDLGIQDGIAVVNLSSISPWKNIHRLGTDRKASELILNQGIIISPAEIASLAAVGKSEVVVTKLPKTAIISTGDELVEVHEIPEPHQIRKSNTHALHASLGQMGIIPDAIHLPDQRDEVINQLTTITNKYEVIILSGGVSKGKKDYIPEALEIIGVEKFFHRVKQRPGKPFWFGATNTATFFALPGNPVATFLCFYKYVKPWLLASLTGNSSPTTRMAELTSSFEFKPPLTHFVQVKISYKNERLMATPIPGHGSGDFTNLNNADGFIELPEGKSQFKAGELYPFIGFR